MIVAGFWIISLMAGLLPCEGGRYKAPHPSMVKFSYKRVPTLTELIEDGGYKHEELEVVTEDGFILALHRVTPRGIVSDNRGVPVLIINGFAFQADGWFLLGNSSLPFVLTDMGYDVWLGEQRGNARSLKHTKYSADDFMLYNYTFHEQGIYDLPAFIDKIRDVSGHDQILYVGYSLSAGMLVVMNSERPEYNKKLLGAVMLAPAAHLRKWEWNSLNYRAAISLVDATISGQIQNSQWLLFGNIDLIKSLFASACPVFPLNFLCQLSITNFYGESDGMDQRTQFYQFGTVATTVSVFVADHLFQIIKNGKFAKYDYQKGNTNIYGRSSPPEYNFNQTTVPLYIIYGGTDNMVAPDAVERTSRDLDGAPTRRKYIKRFNHADFLFSTTAPKKIYEDVVEFFDQLTNNNIQ